MGKTGKGDDLQNDLQSRFSIETGPNNTTTHQFCGLTSQVAALLWSPLFPKPNGKELCNVKDILHHVLSAAVFVLDNVSLDIGKEGVPPEGAVPRYISILLGTVTGAVVDEEDPGGQDVGNDNVHAVVPPSHQDADDGHTDQHQVAVLD